jgi:hypothetical protein
MDIARLCSEIPEWTRYLTGPQQSLLARLMLVRSSKGFSDFDIAEARNLGIQLLRAEEAAARIDELKHAIRNLKPVRSAGGFI